ncbi:hypothetical protein GQ43DRAFT_460667 [Delitschia confertaspora ATCC 74209]|uniref:Uncharacterized protein n=1 Tax=Delitschia confertaspora ATCC 74209 TaxID=1513339 RepID=A0A9P4JXV1_9PLEO|nr:hypothetical protein GQ43DRAFT_460667 [Delitschia confertaspora ATCC 74209]
MRLYIILPALATLSGLASAAVQEYFQVKQENNQFQACFIEGHEYWFCSKPLPGRWQDHTTLVQLGCGYRFQFKKNRAVEITSDNGWYCGYKSHGTLDWDEEEEKFVGELITDHPNC